MTCKTRRTLARIALAVVGAAWPPRGGLAIREPSDGAVVLMRIPLTTAHTEFEQVGSLLVRTESRLQTAVKFMNHYNVRDRSPVQQADAEKHLRRALDRQREATAEVRAAWRCIEDPGHP